MTFACQTLVNIHIYIIYMNIVSVHSLAVRLPWYYMNTTISKEIVPIWIIIALHKRSKIVAQE